MNRPTLALACIFKNEMHNLQQFFDSITDCFDEIHITDTGSDDGTIEWLTEKVNTGWHGAKVFLHHFEWCDDFGKARNYSFSHIKTDYVMWKDGDDVLENKPAFLAWRNTAMGLADYWMATYHYGFDNGGLPVCSFARERVFKVDRAFQWRYPIHEGVPPESPIYGRNVNVNFIGTWAIAHKRTARDMEQDKSRNLKILEKIKDKLDIRLKYYYGKELFDNKQYVEAIHWLMEACSDPKLEMHDRLLAMQYASSAYSICNQFDKAIAVAHQGLQLDPNRAEYWVSIGDAYIKLQKPTMALPAYGAAKSCLYTAPQTGRNSGVIFSSGACYTSYPRDQLARLYINIGEPEKAIQMAKESVSLYNRPESIELLKEIERQYEMATKPLVTADIQKTDDIVISCPPGSQMYEWDADIALKRGIGGSETAAVQMAYWLHKLTGRKVRVFNGRNDTRIIDGVQYAPNTTLMPFLAENEPALHIAWRHTLSVTKARTAVWSHDLITPGIDNVQNYDELMCLSEFHRDYASAMQGVPTEKIWVTRNGIDPKRFLGVRPDKIDGKVMFPSSPDRGLLAALKIMDKVVEKIPHATLHVFYGTDNMRKMGANDYADHLESEMKKRSYVVYHGNIQQDKLAQHFMESEVWLYPASFIETFCITALEAFVSQCWPVATKIGALQNTIGQFADRGMADLLDERAETEGSFATYSDHVISAIEQKKYRTIDFNLDQWSWESVAKEWVEHFKL